MTPAPAGRPATGNGATEPGTARTVTPLRRALTTRGKAVLGGAGMAACAGIALGYPELIGLGVAGVAAIATALGSVARPPRVRVERQVSPDRVSRGTGVAARLEVASDQHRTTPAMAAHDYAGGVPVPCRVPPLRRGTPRLLETVLPTARRGIVRSGPLRFDLRDAFGLAHRVITVGPTSALYVRPRRVELPEVAASLARSLDGPDSDTAMDGTLSFNSLREYVPGDELRRVHWRASAHAGKLVVKQYIDTAHAAVAVILDDLVTDPAYDIVPGPGETAQRQDRRPGQTASPAVMARTAAIEEAFEAAVDCAASIAAIAAAQGQPLRLHNAAGESLLPVTARRGGCTVEDVLDALTLVVPVAAGAVMTVPGPQTPDPLPEALRRLAGSSRGSLAAVVTTRPLGWLSDSLRVLSGGYARVIAVQVTSDPAAALGATRRGRILIATIQQPEDLPNALLRARATA